MRSSRQEKIIKIDVQSFDDRPFSPWECESKNMYELFLFLTAEHTAPIIKRTDVDLIKAASRAQWRVGWLCWGLTSQSTIFQSCRDGAIASWVINQYFRGVKCLAQGHNTAAVGLEPRTSRSGVRHSTTEPPRSPHNEELVKHCLQKYSQEYHM